MENALKFTIDKPTVPGNYYIIDNPAEPTPPTEAFTKLLSLKNVGEEPDYVGIRLYLGPVPDGYQLPPTMACPNCGDDGANWFLLDAEDACPICLDSEVLY